MEKRVSVDVHGSCPETNRLMTIRVEFVEIPIAGNPSMPFKKSKFYCDHANDHGCNSSGSKGLKCPLFLRASYNG